MWLLQIDLLEGLFTTVSLLWQKWFLWIGWLGQELLVQTYITKTNGITWMDINNTNRFTFTNIINTKGFLEQTLLLLQMDLLAKTLLALRWTILSKVGLLGQIDLALTSLLERTLLLQMLYLDKQN